jgi:hypothetical protein
MIHGTCVHEVSMRLHCYECAEALARDLHAARLNEGLARVHVAELEAENLRVCGLNDHLLARTAAAEQRVLELMASWLMQSAEADPRAFDVVGALRVLFKAEDPAWQFVKRGYFTYGQLIKLVCALLESVREAERVAMYHAEAAQNENRLARAAEQRVRELEADLAHRRPQ